MSRMRKEKGKTFFEYVNEPHTWTDRQQIFVEFAKREPLIKTITTYCELAGVTWWHMGDILNAEAMFVWDSYLAARNNRLLV